MSSDLSLAGITTASLGLFASQAAIDAAGNDITNANTEGYSREQITLTPLSPYGGPSGAAYADPRMASIGGGVDFKSVQRVRDGFLDDQFRKANLGLGEQDTMSKYIKQIQGLFDEPSSNGIQAQLNNYFDAWNTVASDPTQAAGRGALVQSAASLAGALNSASAQLTAMRSQINDEIGSSVSEINDDLKQLAGLNQQISTALGTGSQPNALMDQRDELLDKLSKNLNLQLSDRSDGSVWVYVSGKALVQGVQYTPLGTSVNAEAPLSNITYDGEPLSANQLGGGLKAMLNLRDSVIGRPAVPSNGSSDLQNTPQGLIYQLDTMANSLATATNKLTTAGTDLNGNPGKPFFVINSTASAGAGFNTVDITAANIAVNPAFSAAGGLNLIAAGSAPSGGVTPPPGDNGTATAAAELRTSLISNSVFASTSSGTFTANDLYRNMLTQLGTEGQAADSDSKNQQALVDQINTQRQSTSGVNLDEEMSNMIKFQHSYAASARLISTFDGMLDTIINGMGGK